MSTCSQLARNRQLPVSGVGHETNFAEILGILCRVDALGSGERQCHFPAFISPTQPGQFSSEGSLRRSNMQHHDLLNISRWRCEDKSRRLFDTAFSPSQSAHRSGLPNALGITLCPKHRKRPRLQHHASSRNILHPRCRLPSVTLLAAPCSVLSAPRFLGIGPPQSWLLAPPNLEKQE
ncbi:hypothetical protein BGZ60DRAFT_527519 [Tricladium varicosporioides]|nr:hypothetical protein BGZ60DRAFT_527519 [Hymenoscyphus varicosporioides]